MDAFFAAIAHNLRRLAEFRGRDSQILFWPYAGFVYLLATLVSTGLVLAPIMAMTMRMMEQIAEAARQGGTADPAFVKSPEILVPDLGGLWLPMIAINLVTIALLAAAIVRRLHDKDRSGLWALLPLPTMLIANALMPTAFSRLIRFDGPPNPAAALLMINNIVGFALLIALVLLLIGKGTEGPNRFGPGSAPPSHPRIS